MMISFLPVEAVAIGKTTDVTAVIEIDRQWPAAFATNAGNSVTPSAV